jgi:hypothetical protein
MSKLNLSICVQCSGGKPTEASEWVTFPFLLNDANRFHGLHLSRDFTIHPPIEGAVATGNYQKFIHRKNPEKVKYTEGFPKKSHEKTVSRSHINFLGVKDNTYQFRSHLWTQAWSDPKTKKTLLPSNVRRWLKKNKWTCWQNGGFHGILGLFQGEVKCEYTYTSYPHSWKTSSPMTVEIETQDTGFQYIDDLGSMCSSWRNRSFSAYLAEGQFEHREYVYFQFRGSKLYMRYSEKLKPDIYDTRPEDLGILVEAFRPAISGRLKDNGKSGIDPETIEISISSTINNSLTLTEINHETPGMEVNEQAFMYRPTHNLEPGMHTIRASISDNHGNQSDI